MKKRLSLVILSVILCVSALCSVMFMTTASAAATPELAATFSFGVNGSASHKDGSTAKTTYTETNNGYTLNITNGSKMYPSSYDAKGNSCIKFGTGSAAGSCSFTVPDDVVLVKIYIAKYKSNTSKVTINGTTNTLTKNSNDGAYDVIEVDTSSKKTVSITTVSGGYRAMMNTIEFYKEGGPSCAHSSVTAETTKEATCVSAGTLSYVCDECGEVTKTESIPALGHNYGNAVETKAPTCTEDGVSSQTCSRCSEVSTSAIPALGHNFIDGVCSVCGDLDPNACSHANTVTNTVDATKTEDGLEKVICADCDKVLSETVLPALKCAVTFIVPEGATTPVYADRYLTITLPDAVDAPAKYTKYEYVFVGWAMESVDGSTESPVIYKAGDVVELTDDTTFYAIYSYSESNVEPGYSLVDDITSVESGKTVVITVTKGGKIYALSNDKGTSGPPVPVELTVSGGKIAVSGVPANVKWYFENNGGKMSFYVNSTKATWLYVTNTNNGVRVGTGADNVFEITSNYLHNVGTNRFLGVYNTQDWRSYTSTTTNIGGQTYGFYVLNEAEVYYTVNLEIADCEHSYEGVVTKPATCTEYGEKTYTCSACGESYTESIPLAEHDYIEKVVDATCNSLGSVTTTCSTCDYTKTEIIAVKAHRYVDGVCECGKKEPLAEFTFGENSASPDAAEGTSSDGKEISGAKTYTVVGADGKEYALALTDTSKVSDGAIDAIGNSCLKLGTSSVDAGFTFAVPEGVGKVVIYVAGYKANAAKISVNGTEYEIKSLSKNGEYDEIVIYTYGGVEDITVKTVGSRAKIDGIDFYAKESAAITGASISAGADLSFNYNVVLPEGDDASLYVMEFEMNGFVYEVEGVLVGEKYVFSFKNIAPQSIADLVNARLLRDGVVVAEKLGYSIKAWAADFVEAYGDDPAYELYIVLLGDILAYGEAANDYTGFKPEADFSVDGLAASDKAPEGDGGRSVSESLVEGVEFTGAGVRFQYNNKIYVKFVGNEDVSLLVNGEAVAAELGADGKYIFYTDGILATDFDEVFTFELVVDDEVVQTLTYSVNAYSIAKYQADSAMGRLAHALYRYGASAEAILNSAK